MQDIPRNELLDKLAAGWKVRRKDWKNFYDAFNRADLIANDWEGEPPEPVRSYKSVDIVTAFRHLQGGAAFIRRTSWGKAEITSKPSYVRISADDILATDWEVWG
jgi:hypothetical protein